MPNQPPVWGPHHQQGLPGGIQLTGGGYWWGITTGCWLVFFAVLGMNSGTGGEASAAAVIVVMTAAAAAVGWGEAQHGKRFASGRWVLFASATVASSAAYFLPAMAYVGGYFVQQHHARQQRSPKIAALAAAQRQTPAPPAPASAAKRFFRKLLKGLRYVPRVLVTDKLASYGVAHRQLMGSVAHRQSRYLNNRAENSHQPTRQRERAMKRFKSVRHAQRFLSAFSAISAHFRPRRHRLSATQWRTEIDERFAVWREVTALDAAA